MAKFIFWFGALLLLLGVGLYAMCLYVAGAVISGVTGVVLMGLTIGIE